MADDQQLQADQYKEHGIQYLIHKFPEGVQPFPGEIRHTQIAAMVADHQPGNNNCQGGRDVDHLGKTIASHYSGQGQEYLDMIVVDTFYERIGEIAKTYSIEDSASGLDGYSLFPNSLSKRSISSTPR